MYIPFLEFGEMTENPFHLRIDGWNSESESDCEESHPPLKKKLKLSLSKKGKCKAKKENSDRFKFFSNARLETLGKKFVPKNTESSSKWALSNFLSWMDNRNATLLATIPQSKSPKFCSFLLMLPKLVSGLHIT